MATKLGQPRFGRQQVVVPGVGAALVDVVADRQQVARGVVEEVHSPSGQRAGAVGQPHRSLAGEARAVVQALRGRRRVAVTGGRARPRSAVAQPTQSRSQPGSAVPARGARADLQSRTGLGLVEAGAAAPSSGSASIPCQCRASAAAVAWPSAGGCASCGRRAAAGDAALSASASCSTRSVSCRPPGQSRASSGCIGQRQQPRAASASGRRGCRCPRSTGSAGAAAAGSACRTS